LFVIGRRIKVRENTGIFDRDFANDPAADERVDAEPRRDGQDFGGMVPGKERRMATPAAIRRNLYCDRVWGGEFEELANG
jgi:hypothetical protein